METLKLGMRGCRGTLLKCRMLELSLRVILKQIPRGQNSHIDSLAMLATL